ncbi:M48 family metalloprotease [Sphaerisporangium rufum]|nr:M48 family metallopeptidase [Sphaerisporangium rufum]
MATLPTAIGDTHCPACAGPLTDDPRFVRWCPACDWNIDPAAAPPAPAGTGRRQRRAARRAAARRATDRAITQRVYADSRGRPGGRRGRDRAGIAVLAIATAVHLVTLALVAGSAWLALTGSWLTRSFGLIGLAAAVLLRPRLGGPPVDEWALDRAEAPRLYALADRIAAELGVPPVDVIRAVPEFNAGYARPRGRRVLTIGLALWETLPPQERVALLAHELGHARNGDPRRGLWFRSARDALSHWHEFTRPGRIVVVEEILTMAGVAMVTLLTYVPHKLVGMLLDLVHRLTLRSGQRAEYLADDLAARVASSAATRSMLEALALGDSAALLIQRRANLHHGTPSTRRAVPGGDDFGLWAELREYLASIPPHERLRRARLALLRMSSADDTHPPTHLRIRMIDSTAPRPAAVTLAGAAAEAIQAELGPIRARAARAVLTSQYLVAPADGDRHTVAGLAREVARRLRPATGARGLVRAFRAAASGPARDEQVPVATMIPSVPPFSVVPPSAPPVLLQPVP